MEFHLGDLVRWPEQRLTGIIVQFVGDYNVRLFCEKWQTAQPFATSCRLVGHRDETGRQQFADGADRAVWLRLTEQAKRHEGKSVLKRSRQAPTEIRNAQNAVIWKQADEWYFTGEDGTAGPPGKGMGAPHKALPPLRLAQKRSSEWSPDLAAYLGYWVDDGYLRAMRWLWGEHELLAITLFHLYDAEHRKRTHAEIATLMGTTVDAVEQRISRARRLMRDFLGTPESVEASFGPHPLEKAS